MERNQIIARLISVANKADEEGRYSFADKTDAFLKQAVAPALYERLQQYPHNLDRLHTEFSKRYPPMKQPMVKFKKRPVMGLWVAPDGSITDLGRGKHHNQSVYEIIDDMPPEISNPVNNFMNNMTVNDLMGTAFGMIRVYFSNNKLYVSSKILPTSRQFMSLKLIENKLSPSRYYIEQRLPQASDSPMEFKDYRDLDEWYEDVKQYDFSKPDWGPPGHGERKGKPQPAESGYKKIFDQIQDEESIPDPKALREKETTELYQDPKIRELYTKSANLQKFAVSPSLYDFIQKHPFDKQTFLKGYLDDYIVTKDLPNIRYRSFASLWIMPDGSIVDLGASYHEDSLEYAPGFMQGENAKAIEEIIAYKGTYNFVGAVYGMIRVHISGKLMYVSSTGKPTQKQMDILRQIQNERYVPNLRIEQYYETHTQIYFDMDEWFDDLEKNHDFVETDWSDKLTQSQPFEQGESGYKKTLKDIEWLESSNADPKKERELELRKLYPNDPKTQSLYTQSAQTKHKGRK